MTFKIKATHRDSTRKIGEIFLVKPEPVIGDLTKRPMYEMVEKIDGRTQFIIVDYCEAVE